MRNVQHPAIQGQRCDARIVCKQLDHPSRVGQFLGAGREALIDDRHLVRVDREFAFEAIAARLLARCFLAFCLESCWRER